jgi:hypothetical protein
MPHKLLICAPYFIRILLNIVAVTEWFFHEVTAESIVNNKPKKHAITITSQGMAVLSIIHPSDDVQCAHGLWSGENLRPST